MTLAARDRDNTRLVPIISGPDHWGVPGPSQGPHHQSFPLARDTGHCAPWVTSLLHLSHRRQEEFQVFVFLGLHFSGPSKTIPGPKHDTQSNKSAKK